ncbi:MAG: PKD domain-containing protein, partial [Acidobacteriota bacterium]
PNGSIASYNWNFGDGTTGTGANASHTYAVAGNYTATLTIKDSANMTASKSLTINASAPAAIGNPVANIAASVTSGTTPLTVTFDASASTSPNGGITNYNWDFGDGMTTSAKVFTKTYTTAGNYTATLTITDVANKMATATRIITVASSSGGGGTTKTITLSHGDGKASSLTYDTSIMAAYPEYTIDTTYDGRIGGPNGAITLIAMPNLIGTGSDQIPPGAQITSATLTLSIYSAQATGITAARLLDPNNKGIWYTGAAPSNNNVGVSYYYRDARSGSLKKWSDSASNITQTLASSVATFTLNGNEPTGHKINLNVTASVAAWATGAPNQGWAIRATTATPETIFVYASENYSNLRPTLTVQYTTAGSPPTGSSTTLTLRNGDGQAGSTSYDVTMMASYPTYSLHTNANNRIGGSNRYSTVIAFPNLFGNSTGQIPAGAQIISATLTFSLVNSNSMMVDLARVLDPNNKGIWYTGTASSGYNVGVCYARRNGRNSIRWADGKANISQTVQAETSQTVTAGTSKLTFDVTTSVAAWAAGAPNQGWWLSTPNNTAISLYDSLTVNISLRPLLTVTYTK